MDAREAVDPTEMILQAIDREQVDEAIVRIRYHIEEAQVPQIDGPRIREALRSAAAIASIERTVDPAERQRRNVVTRESSLQDAMTQYLAQHENLASIKDKLIEAALALEATYEARRRAEE